MKIVFFDLGNTLEYQNKLLPDAIETLKTIKRMNDSTGIPVVLALISDFYMPEKPEEIPFIQKKIL